MSIHSSLFIQITYERPDILFVCLFFQLPDLTEGKVVTYLELFSQDLRQKSKNMYEGQFLRSIRIGQHDEDTYIIGRVSAEMSKKAVYKTDVKLDTFGVVTACQCECGAGEGPEAHCKHVALVLYALTHIRTGIITKQTCTQTLQTFHQTKSYKGSPVKMGDLKLRASESLTRLKSFDPRPLSMRKRSEYRSEFRSVWINSRAPDLLIRQLYGPANIYGLANDHDYMADHMEDKFLKNLGVSHCGRSRRSEITTNTHGQASNKLWKEERSLRIHSSDFGRICRRTDRTDSQRLARELVNSANKELNAEPVKHGKRYESTAIAAYEKMTASDVKSVGIVVSPTHPFLGCSPDGMVGTDRIVEVKCPYTARNNEITPVSVPYLYTNYNGNLSLKESHPYYYQIMGTLFCTERKMCTLVVWTFKDVALIDIVRDEAFISKMLWKLYEFYHVYFRDALLSKRLYRNSHMLQ